MRSRTFIIKALMGGLLCLAVGRFAAAQEAPKQGYSDHVGALIPLEGETLKGAFSGKTMDGTYKIARQRTGTNQFTETFNSDGTADYFEGPIVDKGQWIVRGKLICFRYDGALAGGISCFNVYQTGTCLYSYNPANIGQDGFPINNNLWSVKTVTRGDISSCGDLIS